jgi:hypothetical protein
MTSVPRRSLSWRAHRTALWPLASARGSHSRSLTNGPAIEVHEPGEVYARDEFVYWGFSPEGLRRLGRIVGLDEIEIVDELEIDGHPRILALLRAAD